MKSRMFLIGCVAIACSIQFSSAQEKKPEVRPAQFGIIYPLSTNGAQASQISNVFSLNAFMGISAGVEAAEFSGFMSITNGNVHGVQASGYININRGDIDGVHAAGFLNISKKVDGVQLAGFCNLAKDIKGVQAAGFVNVGKNCEGAQLSGFVGVADNVKSLQVAGFIAKADSVEGLQGSGFLNINKKTNGAQLTSFLNKSGDVNGAQGAGFMNIGKNVKGAQISGFLNIGKNVEGAQISGFMNISDSCDYPIGIINLVKSGTKHIVVETDENTAANVLFKSGGRRTYGIFGFSYLPVMSKAQYGVVAGMGIHFPVSTSLNIDVDGASSFYYDYAFKKDEKMFFTQQLRVLLNYKLNNRISFFGGPKLSFAASDNNDIDDLRGLELWSGKLEHNRHHGNRHFSPNYGRLLLGANVGIEISLK